MGRTYFDDTWDFRGADTKRFTHCFHNYPAIMIPQVAERLLVKYGGNADLLFDPYCGVGTSLLEANLKGINSVGTDLNPLATLVARAKTTKVDIRVLDLYLKEFNEYLLSIRFEIGASNVVVPSIKNIDYWFSDSVQKELTLIKEFINGISESSISDFFKVAFSETVRESSWTRNGEFKMFRMSQEQIQKFAPDVFGLMESKLWRNRKGLKEFVEEANGAVSSVFDFNSVETIENIEDESVDIVVTSPPYGDSRTTVAYGQFSRLANEWLDVENATGIDRELMGGNACKQNCSFGFEELDRAVHRIKEKDEKRAKEVKSFYLDYRKSIHNVANTVKKGGNVCYVVGNRKVKGIMLPTDEVTRFFFHALGFQHIETIIRNIPNKRMPSKNSPTNIVGKTDVTMSNEYIVVMRRRD